MKLKLKILIVVVSTYDHIGRRDGKKEDVESTKENKKENKKGRKEGWMEGRKEGRKEQRKKGRNGNIMKEASVHLLVRYLVRTVHFTFISLFTRISL